MTFMMHFLLYLPLVLSNLYIIFDVKLASAHCLSEQKGLLLQLRSNLTYDSSLSTKLGSWEEHTDCCSWRGVHCDDAGHVIDLDLSSDSITGNLDDSSSLFSLQFLQRLSLAGNSFDSTDLPKGFGLLNQLVYLNLSETGFAGQIPSNFSRMSRLVTLDLSTFSLSYLLSLKLENPNLNMLVQNLTRLIELRLDGVDIAAAGVDWCNAVSSALLDLQVLSLSNCNISGPFDSSLAKLQSLSVVKLDGNKFSASLPGFFAKFANLTTLSASSCDLLGEAPQQIFQLPTLRTIDLSNNRELGGCLPEFPENGFLESLDLSYTSFSGNLPDSVGNLKKLSSLKLFGCNFSGPIPSSISNLSELVSVDLAVNYFTGSLPSFTLSRNLSSVSLRDNKLMGKIPLEWEGLKHLTILDLSNNSLSGELPALLFSLPSLESLKLPNNQFSGQINELEGMYPSPLGELDLSSNNLEGPIPQFVFKITSLSSLSLAFNKFTSTVELVGFIEMKSLADLDLSYNNLSVGTRGSDSAFSLLPQFNSLMLASCKLQKFPLLKNQSRLNMLDLSNNQITGDIPNWIWEIDDGYLRYLNLSHNDFTGLQEPYHFQTHFYLDIHSNLLTGAVPLPPPSAVYVDFSSNKFTSSLAADIGNLLSSAIYLNIANNSIVDDIPLSLCNATLLEVLDLSDNSLSGSMPSCLMEMSRSLVVLNLHGNKLSGNIPNTLPRDCKLETLDLSFNQLEGEIPQSLVNCRKLKVLNLGHNRIGSTFPCRLDKLTNMRVLVLHSNRFSGKISCPNSNYSWAHLQIIDLSSNNFNGVLPPKFFSSLGAMMVDGDKSNLHLDLLHYQGRDFKTYYQDTVTMAFKGTPTTLTKVLTTLTSIDLSSNNFQGSISEKVGDLISLLLLNLSNNALTGQIPSSVGNLKNLESLDLSSNQLTGEIPENISSLTFLSVLNLSHNQLVGRIPGGRQMQTFLESSFEGNSGLCGFQLNRTCNGDRDPALPESQLEEKQLYSKTEIYISVAVGSLVGLAFFVGPLWLSKRWRICYNKNVDQLILRIFNKKGKQMRKNLKEDW
ncbi:receptor-like protein 33 [Coffea eugenioides]|uniref:receptor-like protein 33 n=1 Tax=Coffea eugenioides TaxID=49369 RepID=UPI000F61288E|nr:receptor-like protein 33 [Coffea eugenioides]